MTTFEYLRQSHTAFPQGGDSGAGGSLGAVANAGPAHPLTVGAVGFGRSWEDEPSLRELYDIACKSIVRMECEAEEKDARIALLEEQARILKSTIDGYRDEACRESCRDKAKADGGWSNI